MHAHHVPGSLGIAVRPELADVEERMLAMDRAGIAIQVLSPFVNLSADLRDPATAVPYARRFNEAMAQTVRANPRRFLALATVPADGGPGELEYAVRQLGMAGVQMAASPRGPGLEHRDTLWAAAEELGCLVFIHPTRGTGDALPYGLDNLVGNPAETTTAIARMILGGVFDRFPGLRVCVAHGGGFLPWQIGRLERGAEVFGPRLSRSPREVLSDLYFDTILHDPATLAHLNPARLLLGTDHPFEMGDRNPHATIAAIPGLTPAERAAITHHNAQALLSPFLP
ncbi:amidohydrolase family protein [Nonomuraea sp. NPDC050790]|uniref:amidohydrolase family protein n=1 Tax=Nonomuraea sp. NPDC050790 TaxID=3364371 RepID=UPI0037A3768C